MSRCAISWATIIAAALFAAGACSDDPNPFLVPDAAADGAASGDADTDSDADSDADADGDSDTGDPVEEDEPCEILLWDYVIMAGLCQPSGDGCPGGTFPGDPTGNCADGLDCCIHDDQCEVQAMGFASCQPDECTLGYPVGCPDGGWCCLL